MKSFKNKNILLAKNIIIIIILNHDNKHLWSYL